MRIRTLAFAFAALAALAAPHPKVKFTTNLGSFTLELDPDAAPKTVANFLDYVNRGHYKGTTFHRIIPGFMVQGGGMTESGAEKPTQPPVTNEAKLAQDKGWRNVRGTVAMARTPNPHSATSQFFVNVVDNAFLDFPGQDGWGYCAFGKVVEGMDTVDKLAAVPTGPGNRPTQAVTITAAVQEGAPAPAKKPKARKKK
jgi:cyclophilin family peptidyl-prolyl cis-trans isomerase